MHIYDDSRATPFGSSKYNNILTTNQIFDHQPLMLFYYG